MMDVCYDDDVIDIKEIYNVILKESNKEKVIFWRIKIKKEGEKL